MMNAGSMRRVLLALAVGLFLNISQEGVLLRAETQTAATASSVSASERSKALSSLLAEIWEDTLRHSPEFASTLGDKRYDDQLTDYSPEAANASLARGLGFIQRLG